MGARKGCFVKEKFNSLRQVEKNSIQHKFLPESNCIVVCVCGCYCEVVGGTEAVALPKLYNDSHQFLSGFAGCVPSL